MICYTWPLDVRGSHNNRLLMPELHIHKTRNTYTRLSRELASTKTQVFHITPMHSIQTMREMEYKLKEAQTAESLQEQYQYLGNSTYKITEKSKNRSAKSQGKARTNPLPAEVRALRSIVAPKKSKENETSNGDVWDFREWIRGRKTEGKSSAKLWAIERGCKEEEAQGTNNMQQQNLQRESLGGLRAEEGCLPSKPNYEARHSLGRCSIELRTVWKGVIARKRGGSK